MARGAKTALIFHHFLMLSFFFVLLAIIVLPPRCHHITLKKGKGASGPKLWQKRCWDEKSKSGYGVVRFNLYLLKERKYVSIPALP